MALDGCPLEVPRPPNDEDLACERRLMALFKGISSKDTVLSPTPVSISGTSTSNNTTMSFTAPPSYPRLQTTGILLPVPMKLIPIVKKHFSDRHLRETYKYFKLFVAIDRRDGLSESPEGVTEKMQWKEQMVQIGKDVRFLGRKEYQKAVQETISGKCLTMSCGQDPKSWNDYLGALFNPREYNNERRELVYWIQFGLLKDGNSAWIHRQETQWCSDKYGVEIVYDKGWEGNLGNCNISDLEHGKSFLPFERARGSWLKWYFLKGANEVRELIQMYSLRAHDIYERICISKRVAGEVNLSYTKRHFAHGDGYIAEPKQKRKKLEISTPASIVYTMEGVTAWLRAQGKEVTIVPAAVYVSAALTSDMSSVTRSVEARRATLTTNTVCEHGSSVARLVDLPRANVTTNTVCEREVVQQNVRGVGSDYGGRPNNPTMGGLAMQPVEGEGLEVTGIQVTTSFLL
jgi:hypothetical protein